MKKVGGALKSKLQTIKWVTDVLMTLAMLFLMGYQFWGEQAHEWMGAGIFILFILHHILNRQWYKTLFSGNYTPFRVFQAIVNVLAFVSMLALMYSSIVMSRYVFAFLPISGGMSFARRLHILGSYWGFLLMAIHLGLHWNMFMNIVIKRFQIEKRSKICIFLLFLIGLVVSIFGLTAFIKRDFSTYLLLKSEFVFLDYGEQVLLFYLDYFALMGLCIFVSHYLSKLLKKIHRRKAVAK